MFAYAGSSREELERLVSALQEAAKRDPIAEKAHLRKSIHSDGWGYAMYSDRKLTYHRSGRPIFEEGIVLPPTGGRMLAIFHARQASVGNPRGEKFSHPFCSDAEDGLILLAHNGTLDKGKLARRLRFDGDLGDITDSELVLKYAARMGLAAASTDLKDCTKPNSALDLLALEVRTDGRAEVFVNHFYRETRGGFDRAKYYELYQQSFPRGTAVFSSTLSYYGFSGRPIGHDGLVSLSALERAQVTVGRKSGTPEESTRPFPTRTTKQ